MSSCRSCPSTSLKSAPTSLTETMIWIGMIMGLNSFVAAATAPFWGSLTAKFRPKALFQWPFLSNGIVFLLMGFTDSLPLLLALRLIQGALGGASTIGFFMISQLSPQRSIGRQSEPVSECHDRRPTAGTSRRGLRRFAYGIPRPFHLVFYFGRSLLALVSHLCRRHSQEGSGPWIGKPTSIEASCGGGG